MSANINAKNQPNTVRINRIAVRVANGKDDANWGGTGIAPFGTVSVDMTAATYHDQIMDGVTISVFKSRLEPITIPNLSESILAIANDPDIIEVMMRANRVQDDLDWLSMFFLYLRGDAVRPASGG